MFRGRLADPLGLGNLTTSTYSYPPWSGGALLGDFMCFVPTSGNPGGERRYTRKKLIHTKKVTRENKAEIAKALGVSASKLKHGEELHLVHGKTK
jgi:hypothetical protein